MIIFDRRTLLLALSGSVFVSACKTVADSKASSLEDGDSQPSKKALAPVIRKRWIAGSNAEHQQKYIKAVELLKANDAKFPDMTPAKVEGLTRNRKKLPDGFFLSWKGLVQIHYASCQHQNWYLLPYHRLYLLYFEAACQTVLEDPSFALPYWDWSLDQNVPDEFYDVPVLLEKRALAKGELLPPEALVDPATIQASLGYDFKKFHSFEQELPNPFMAGGGSGFGGGTGRQGSFEAGPHNGVHNFVGGMMADPKSSPTDPLFWLHHSNIDRLWGIWLAQNPDRILPFLTLGEEERKISGGFAKAWGESEVKLDLILNRPWGLEVPLARQDAGLPSGLRPDEEQVLQLLRMFPPLPPIAIKETEKNHAALVSAPVKDLLAAEKLPYFYDSDPETVGKGTTVAMAQNKAKPQQFREPKEFVIDGKMQITSSRLDATIQLTKVPASSLGSLSLSFKNLPVPMDAETRSRLVIYYFIAKANQKDTLPKAVDASSRKHPNFAGSQTLFLVNHNHAGHEMPSHAVSGLIDIANWVQKTKASEGEYLISAFAVDRKNGFQAISLFKEAEKTNLGLRYLAE